MIFTRRKQPYSCSGTITLKPSALLTCMFTVDLRTYIMLMALRFMTVMDGAKTGLRLQDAVRKQDSAKWGGRPKLPWKQTAEDFIDTSNSRSLTRIPKTTFILEDIRKEGRKIEGLLRQTFKDLKPKTIVLNEDLAAPFREYEEKARRAEADGFPIMWKELEQVKTHVERMWKKHRDKISLKKKSLQNSPSKRVAFTALSITERQDVLRELSREFVSVPLSEELIAMTEVDLRRVRASYAYIHDYEECKNSIAKFTRFPWDVATRELCSESLSFFKRLLKLDSCISHQCRSAQV